MKKVIMIVCFFLSTVSHAAIDAAAAFNLSIGSFKKRRILHHRAWRYGNHFPDTENMTDVGSIFSADATYALPHGVTVFASSALSGLIGQLKTPKNPAWNLSRVSDSAAGTHEAHFIPGIDNQVGVHYRHVSDKGATLTIAMGYEYTSYFNQFVAYNPAVSFDKVNFRATSSLGSSLSKYVEIGPFLSVRYRF